MHKAYVEIKYFTEPPSNDNLKSLNIRINFQGKHLSNPHYRI